MSDFAYTPPVPPGRPGGGRMEAERPETGRPDTGAGTPIHEVVVVSGLLDLNQRQADRLRDQIEAALGADTRVIRLEPELSQRTASDFAVAFDPAEAGARGYRNRQEVTQDVMQRLDETGALDSLRQASNRAGGLSGRPDVLEYTDPDWIDSPRVARVFEKEFGDPGGAVPNPRGYGR